MKRLVLFALTLVSLISVGQWVSPKQLYAEPNAASLVYGMQSWEEPKSLDPLAFGYADAPLLIEMQIHEGLARWDANGNPIPAIASSWNAKNAKVWIFNLRQDVYFHNGRQVKAQDFAYSWGRFSNCAKCATNWTTDLIQSVVAVNDFKLKVRLKYPYAAFPKILPLPSFSVIPQEAVANLKKNPVGAGPFKFQAWDKHNFIQLTRYRKYYGTKASLKKLKFQFFPDIDAEYTSFTNGTLDISEVPASAWSVVKTDPNILGPHIIGTQYMYLDTTAYATANLRCALQRSVDPNAIIGAISWNYNPAPLASGMVTPGMGSFNDSDISAVYDPTAALSLLATEGWTDTDSDGILDDGAGQKLSATIQHSTFVGSPSYIAAHVIGNALTDIGGMGVGFQVSYVTSPALGTVYHSGWVSDYPDPNNDLYPWLHPSGMLNFRSHYNNPTVTTNLDSASTTLDENTRNTLLHDAEEIAIETDCVYSPTYRVTQTPRIKKAAVLGLTNISSMGHAAYLNSVSLAP
ncbi:MAG: ABC transporter substrate-binding protein [Anaerolineae bacterium]|nr:ABC transporter substrate-binding protein [Anaerolineae bacterium]